MKSRIMIIRPGALGDTLMLLPSLVFLKERYEIIVVGRSPGLEYLRPHIFKGIDYELSDWHCLFLEPDYNPLPVKLEIEKIVAFLADPEKMAGRNLMSWFPAADVHIFNPFPDKGNDIHTSEYISRCTEKAGIDIDPEICLKRAVEKPLLGTQGGKRNKSRIVIHPGSGSKKKNYPPGFWVKLVKLLQDDPVLNNLRIILLLGPAEEEFKGYYKENLDEGDAGVLFYPEKERLLKELNSSVLYIGHDSGITHLASMLGVCVIALFKNSSLRQWRPLGPDVEVIQEVVNETELLGLVSRKIISI